MYLIYFKALDNRQNSAKFIYITLLIVFSTVFENIKKIQKMKGILFIFLLTLSANVCNAQKELTWHEDINKAIKVSEKTGKPMLLFFTGSDWCGWCIRLQKEVFLTPEFAQWAEENVVLVDLDFPRRKEQDPKIKEQNQKLQQEFQVMGYPTVHFVTPLKKDNNSYSFIPIGKSGYMKGGPSVWCADASAQLSTK